MQREISSSWSRSTSGSAPRHSTTHAANSGMTTTPGSTRSSYEGEKAYQERKAKHRDWEVKSNMVLKLTDEIVKQTPQASSTAWMIFVGAMKVPKVPLAAPHGGAIPTKTPLPRDIPKEHWGRYRGGGPTVTPGILAKDLGGQVPIPPKTSLALGLSETLEAFAESQKSVSVFGAWAKKYIQIPIGDLRTLKQFFHAISEAFLQTGGRLKFDLTGLKVGLEGATTWAL